MQATATNFRDYHHFSHTDARFCTDCGIAQALADGRPCAKPAPAEPIEWRVANDNAPSGGEPPFIPEEWLELGQRLRDGDPELFEGVLDLIEITIRKRERRAA